ncbi:hypothetical protein ACWEN3_46680, partial [Streptomyces sp. NPDC004561]
MGGTPGDGDLLSLLRRRARRRRSAAPVPKRSRSIEGHLTRRTVPDGTTEAWTYDGEDNCTSHT